MKKKISKLNAGSLEKPIYYTIIETEMGSVGIAGNENGLIRLILPERSSEDVWEELNIYFRSGEALIREESLFIPLTERIRAYFEGNKVEFDKEKLNLSPYTPFQRKVLLKTREIPYGVTRTYLWLAEQSRFPRAYRAAGGVMRMNPLPLIIPCHRVLGRDGRLTGFSSQGGIELKRKMLALEGVIIRSKR
ncbi:MAG: methylated-DNA--[protein]-cysteine S-methyltransferase [Atribacterota bacterium]|nr:methylated-DNA--[protein]-cysteine S-methyltransferase [Atribacterota bacterium]